MKEVPNTELWVWLAESLNPGNRKAKALISCFGTIDAVYAAGAEQYKAAAKSINEKDIKRLSDKSVVRANKIISECTKKNMRIITPDSSEYPERLWNIPTPPAVLYALGEHMDIDNEPAIAVVGTRNATKNGEESARKIGRELAECGGIVVTGLARGIDTFAAEGALSAGGRTIAVLGCGVDVTYPPENVNIMKAVAKSGTVVSEYPPGTRPERNNFPKRNRIISGLALGTVIIEAPEKSGALITAGYAEEQNRDVFAVPTGIFEAAGTGSNKLIRDGAIPVLSGRDVLTEYAGLFGDKINLDGVSVQKVKSSAQKDDTEKINEEKFSFPKGYLDRFSDDDRAVLTAIAGDILHIDDIAGRCGMRVQKVLSILTLLEIRGHIKQLAGSRFQIKDL